MHFIFMAIDPYKPELAKRQTTFQIAHDQLGRTLSNARSSNSDLRQRLAEVFEAMEDYRQAGESLAEWLEQRQEQNG